LIRPQQQAATNPLFNEATLGWKELVSEVRLGQVQGDHAHMLGTPAVEEIAAIVRQTLDKPR
jgi:thioesterase domain-containing protein